MFHQLRNFKEDYNKLNIAKKSSTEIDNLPNEVISAIFDFLDLKIPSSSIKTLSEVNKKFSKAIDYHLKIYFSKLPKKVKNDIASMSDNQDFINEIKTLIKRSERLKKLSNCNNKAGIALALISGSTLTLNVMVIFASLFLLMASTAPEENKKPLIPSSMQHIFLIMLVASVAASGISGLMLGCSFINCLKFESQGRDTRGIIRWTLHNKKESIRKKLDENLLKYYNENKDKIIATHNEYNYYEFQNILKAIKHDGNYRFLLKLIRFAKGVIDNNAKFKKFHEKIINVESGNLKRFIYH